MIPFVIAVLGSGFADGPIPAQVEAGKKLAGKFDRDAWQERINMPPLTDKRTDISIVFGKDRKVIGTWSEGVRKLDAEWVIELTPELMSRWLGFLEMREAWPDGELEHRWETLRQQIGGRPVFVVILSAFPRKELFGLEEDTPPTTEEIENIRIVFEQNGRNIEALDNEFWRQRAETRSQLDAVPWWQFTKIDLELTSIFETGFEPPIVQRGNYYRSWRWVVPATDLAPGKFHLKVASRRKIRHAEFTYPAASSDTSTK